jgi:hypothetical protein
MISNTTPSQENTTLKDKPPFLPTVSTKENTTSRTILLVMIIAIILINNTFMTLHLILFFQTAFVTLNPKPATKKTLLLMKKLSSTSLKVLVEEEILEISEISEKDIENFKIALTFKISDNIRFKNNFN